MVYSHDPNGFLIYLVTLDRPQCITFKMASLLVKMSIIRGAKLTSKYTVQLNLSQPWKYILLYYNVFQYQFHLKHVYFVVNICMLSFINVMILKEPPPSKRHNRNSKNLKSAETLINRINTVLLQYLPFFFPSVYM